MTDPERFTQADLQPFKDSGINVFHPAVGTRRAERLRPALQFFSAWNSFLATHDQYFMRIDSAADFDRVKARASRRPSRRAELRAFPHAR